MIRYLLPRVPIIYRLAPIIFNDEPRAYSAAPAVKDWQSISVEWMIQAAPKRSKGSSFAAGSWGWLPAISLISGLGLLVAALADAAGRSAANDADPLFWVGLLLLFAPAALRLLSHAPARRERIGLLLLLGVGLYLVKVLESPLALSWYDEFQHWRTVQDIAATGHLFSVNPLLPISPYFPGLELVTDALSALTGLPLNQSGVIVVGAARILLMLALYLCYEMASDSPRIAGVAALLFTANPLFLFFDAQFAYESLALPLAVLVVFCCLRTAKASASQRFGWIVFTITAFVTVCLTHHLTAIALVILLAILGSVALVRHHGKVFTTVWQPGWRLIFTTGVLFGIAGVAIAARFVGGILIQYLSTTFSSAMQGIANVLTGNGVGHALFQDGAGRVAPGWEQVTAIAFVVLIVLALPFGFVFIMRVFHDSTVAVALGAAALFFPVSQAFRLTNDGSEIATRSMDLLFLAVAFTVAISASRLTQSLGRLHWRQLVVTSLLATIFVGGVIAGAGPMWERLPGPYLPASDSRSITPDGIAAAQWSLAVLGPNQRFIADRVNEWLLGTYGLQNIVTVANTHMTISSVFFDPTYGSWQRGLFTKARVQYAFIDLRLSEGLPGDSVYYDNFEPGANHHTTPISLASLEKFDGAAGLNRIYDNGNVVIYATVN